jgi:hypothetical protein
MSNNTASRRSRFRRYGAYGVSIRSDMSLPLPMARCDAFFELQIRERSTPILPSIRQKMELRRNPFSAFDVGSLSEGSNYVGLRDVGEYLVSRDGRHISCYRLPRANPESFNVYLLGQALSFALVKNGIEPLHATAVVAKGRAIGFLGDCGFGKSTLAAEFVKAGHRLLTDDLSILRKTGQQVLAYPGPPRIKLFPEIAHKLRSGQIAGVPMNSQTRKLIVPLSQGRTCQVAIPFAAFYALPSPDEIGPETNVSITTLTRKEAFLKLLASAFNISILDPCRLKRQFDATQALANSVVVKKLFYPRALEFLPLVRKAILSDLVASACEALPFVV